MNSIINRFHTQIFGFSLGGFATLAQVILFREALTICGGNELILGIAFAIWLCGVGIGAIVADRIRDPKRWFTIGAVLTSIVVVGSLLSLRLHRAIIEVPVGGMPSIALLIIALGIGLAPTSFIVGFLFTCGVKSHNRGDKKAAGKLYAFEAIGALFSGLLFAFVLVAHADPISSLVASALVITLAATSLFANPMDLIIKFTSGFSL